jgi:hypothetical protein
MTITCAEDRLLLNETVVKVLEYVNGTRTIKDIIDAMISKYGEDNSTNYIAEVASKSIDLMLGHNIIAIKQSDVFEGWIVYE